MLHPSDAPTSGAPVTVPAAVELLRWPAEAERRAALAVAGRPRILLIAPAAPPPMTWDPLEDWVREPASADEVEARAFALANRSEAGRPRAAPLPVLDADGLLRHGGSWVAIPRIEARLLGLLLNRIGEVVHRTDLLAAGWPAGVPSVHVLDGRIKLLRRRLARLGLRIHTVRGAGFLLEQPDPL